MRIKGATGGYTMVEMLVVMVILAVVMTLIGVTFSGVVQRSGQLIKAAETDTGGLIGLELMRSDLERAGFGLPWSVPSAVIYSEAHDDLQLVQGCPDGCPNAKPASFDDDTYSSETNVPRAYRFGNNVGYNSSDYLVLKGSSLGTSRVARTWAYLNYSSIPTPRYPLGGEQLRFEKDDRTVVIRTGIDLDGPSKELVSSGSSFSFAFDPAIPAMFVPRERGDTYLIYGVALKASSALSFPFNRADYYISRPDDDKMSSTCNTRTGVLYKSVITQGGGSTGYPILDCAADMQVVLFWDTDNDGTTDYHSGKIDEVPFEEVVATPAEFREQLKEIRVYILAQVGKIDHGYSYPVTSADEAIVVGDSALNEAHGSVLGRVWKSSELAATFGENWRNYHWRVYQIVVQPKNL